LCRWREQPDYGEYYSIADIEKQRDDAQLDAIRDRMRKRFGVVDSQMMADKEKKQESLALASAQRRIEALEQEREYERERVKELEGLLEIERQMNSDREIARSRERENGDDSE